MSEHAHDWPVVSIFVLGAYLNETEIGPKFIAGPSVVFYRAGAAHRNTVAADGFEQIEIEFDPTWLGRSFLPDVPVKHWISANVRLGSTDIRSALRGFLTTPAREPAVWVNAMARRLKLDPSLRVQDLARAVSRHPSWIGSAYRRATGEGLQAAAARYRVERAARLLRESQLPFAQIALDSGFCDQSHMNRTFRRVLGRSPTEVRADRLNFRAAIPIPCAAPSI